MQHVVSALFLPPAVNETAGAMLTGMPRGEIYVWKGTAASQIVPAHKPGPEVAFAPGPLGKFSPGLISPCHLPPLIVPAHKPGPEVGQCFPCGSGLKAFPGSIS